MFRASPAFPRDSVVHASGHESCSRRAGSTSAASLRWHSEAYKWPRTNLVNLAAATLLAAAWLLCALVLESRSSQKAANALERDIWANTSALHAEIRIPGSR